MTEQIHDVPTMHDDHRQWQSEHSMWQQDIEVWTKQLERGFGELVIVKQMMSNLQEVLKHHRLRIQERESRLQQHELEMSKCEKLGLEYPENLTILHLETNQQFKRDQEEHARLKSYHHSLLAKLENLVNTIQETNQKR